MKPILAALLACLALTAGAREMPIAEKIYQDIGEALQAPIGGQVLKVIRKATIQNSEGKADAFGRAYDRGFRELRYQGVTTDGRPVLRYLEVAIEPGGAKVPRKLGTVKQARLPAGVMAYSQDKAIPTTASPAGSEPLPAEATDMLVDLTKARDFRFGTVHVTITSADKTSIHYTLQRTFKSN